MENLHDREDNSDLRQRMTQDLLDHLIHTEAPLHAQCERGPAYRHYLYTRAFERSPPHPQHEDAKRNQDMKVLVTGMSGLIGKAVRKELEGDYELRALNRSAMEGVACVRADISDFDAIRPAFDGIDKVIHLAALARAGMDWDQLLPFNVIGTYNVFEAARQAGVKRVVYASSGATISGYEGSDPYKALAENRFENAGTWDMLTHESPPHPKGIYGCTKIWGEALARHFSDSANMSMIGLRIGAVNAEDHPKDARQKSVWCSQSDISRMVRASLEAPDDLKYDIFFVVSDNKYSYRDMQHPKEVLGFEPQDSADNF